MSFAAVILTAVILLCVYLFISEKMKNARKFQTGGKKTDFSDCHITYKNKGKECYKNPKNTEKKINFRNKNPDYITEKSRGKEQKEAEYLGKENKQKDRKSVV